jgi:hypothetical protein
MVTIIPTLNSEVLAEPFSFEEETPVDNEDVTDFGDGFFNGDWM